MKGVDYIVDPVSGDYELDAAGKWIQGDPILNKIALSLTLPLASWEGDPLLGHRLGELARAVDSAENRQKVARFVRLALQWLLDTGELTRVDVVVQELAPGTVAFETTCYAPGRAPIKGSWRVPTQGAT